MKKIFGLFFLVFLMNGCDDGDATVENVTFDDGNAANCGQLIYRITDNRAMIIKLPADSDAFTNDPTLPGAPRQKIIGTGAAVTYRVYNGAVSGDVFCVSPAPISPTAVLEWPANRGIVEINTTAVLTEPDDVTGQTKISKYKHNIVFRSLEFAKPDGTTQNYSEYVFGNYYTTGNALQFAFDPNQVKKCPSANLLYNAQNSGAEALVINNFDTALLDTSVLNTPKTAVISDTANAVSYRLLTGSIPSGENETFFCIGSATIGDKELWQGIGGANGLNATIEVVTTTNGSGFLHTIRLKNITFKKGNSTFYYGYDMLYGLLLQ